MSKPRKKYNPRKHRPSFDTFKLAIGQAMNTATNDVDILDEPLADYERLLLGTVDVEGFTRLCEMAVATFCAGKLLIERGTPGTKELGATFRMTGMVASDELQAIGERYRTTGRLVGTGEQYRNVKDALDAMRNIIPVLSRGELLTVLHEAAQIVEEGIETAKRIKRAERKAA